MGRKTYEVGLNAGITSPYELLQQFVVTDSLRKISDSAVNLHHGDPLELTRRLKAQHGKDIWLCGGAKLAASVFADIDELILKVNPALIGAGIPLFDGIAIGTALLEYKTYPNGFVLAHYRISGGVILAFSSRRRR